MWDAIPEIIRAFSDAGVSGHWMGACLVTAIAGFFWGGRNLRAMRHNVADHLKSMGDKLAEH
jgi:hypothetical protein